MTGCQKARVPYLTLGMIAVLFISACVGASPKAAFFSLEPVRISPLAEASPKDLALALGPVVIPSTHDRPQIVTRDAQNNPFFDEYHRWSGNLGENIAAVLAANLTQLLENDRVATYSGADLIQPDYRIVVVINRFDGRLDDSFLMDVSWSVRKTGRKNPVFVHKSVIREPVDRPGYHGLLAAQNKALARLSREMAETVLHLGDTP